MIKCCTKCGVEKQYDDFYVVEKSEVGNHRRNPICKSCVLEYNRKKYSENPEYREKKRLREKERQQDPVFAETNKQRGKEFYASINGRAKTLFKGAQRRSKQYNEPLEVTAEWIQEKLEKGYCEITRIPFDFSPHPTYSKNPFAPSIDRKDSTKGYTKENTRIVIWQVNLMRGEVTDIEIIEICKKVLEGLTIEREMDMG